MINKLISFNTNVLIINTLIFTFQQDLIVEAVVEHLDPFCPEVPN